MSTKRLGRLQRVATIVPLALLSAAWTASVAGIGGVAAPGAANEDDSSVLEDGPTVPTEAIEAPASVSDPGALDDGNPQEIVSTASTNAIPSAALAAYQRAETVINSADKSCNLTWQLVAAIGRVESNHGRFGGSVLSDDGVAEPAIFGIPLNGKQNTKAIKDTDAGQFDNDTVWDRAVGPMQFIPSTWSVVGVDADNDSQRNPQDIDDAALATAVYLCSGEDDLSETMGQRAAVYRYNHSQSYVDLVLSIMEAYLSGDFTTVPNNVDAAPGYIVPNPPAYNPGSSNYGDGDDTPDYVGETDTDPGEVPPTTDPGPGPGPGGPGPGGPGPGTDDDDKVVDVPNTNVGPVDDVLTLAEAIVQCTLDGVNPLNSAQWNACLDKYTS